MARPRTPQKDILARVTDLGAEALHKLTDIPGGSRMVELANESKTRLDEMQKKLRGLDALELRVAKLERELAKSRSAASKPAASKPAASKPAASKPAASKPAASKPAASKPAASTPAPIKPAIAGKPTTSARKPAPKPKPPA